MANAPHQRTHAFGLGRFQTINRLFVNPAFALTDTVIRRRIHELQAVNLDRKHLAVTVPPAPDISGGASNRVFRASWGRPNSGAGGELSFVY
jgi:hypothetical protein